MRAGVDRVSRGGGFPIGEDRIRDEPRRWGRWRDLTNTIGEEPACRGAAGRAPAGFGRERKAARGAALLWPQLQASEARGCEGVRFRRAGVGEDFPSGEDQIDGFAYRCG